MTRRLFLLRLALTRAQPAIALEQRPGRSDEPSGTCNVLRGPEGGEDELGGVVGILAELLQPREATCSFWVQSPWTNQLPLEEPLYAAMGAGFFAEGEEQGSRVVKSRVVGTAHGIRELARGQEELRGFERLVAPGNLGGEVLSPIGVGQSAIPSRSMSRSRSRSLARSSWAWAVEYGRGEIPIHDSLSAEAAS